VSGREAADVTGEAIKEVSARGPSSRIKTEKSHSYYDEEKPSNFGDKHPLTPRTAPNPPLTLMEGGESPAPA